MIVLGIAGGICSEVLLLDKKIARSQKTTF